MKKLLEKLIINSGVKNTAILISGVMLAQIITFISQPIVTRIYTPEEIGIMSLITALVTMFTPLLGLQYQMGIITAKTDKEANIVSALTFYLLTVMLLIISLGLILYNLIFPTTFEDIGSWIYIVIPLLLFSGLEKIIDSYNNRFEQYKLMSSIALIRSITSNTIKILLGILKLGVFGLIISQFISIIFGIKRQAKYVISKKNEIFSANFSEIKNVAIRYKVQPLFSMPGLFVTTVSFSILPVLITSLYTVEQAGFFSLSISMLGIPLSLISSNVSKVFFRKATIEKEQKGNFYSTFKSTAILLIIVSTVGFSILWCVVEPMFSIVFGNEWSRSGAFVKLLIPLFAIRFVVTGLMHGFIISGKQLLKLVLQSLFILEVFVIYIIVKSNGFSIETFLELINIGYFILYVILFVVLFYTSKKKL